MAYEKIGWKNGQAPLINDVNLNRMDDGIKLANDGVEGLKNGSIVAGDADKINGLTSEKLVKTLGALSLDQVNNSTTLDSQISVINSSIAKAIGLPEQWFHVINLRHIANNGHNSQLFVALGGKSELYMRHSVNGQWQPACHMITSLNTPNVAQYKNGSGTFLANSSSIQINDEFVDEKTTIFISPRVNKEKFWKCESFKGYFIISSHEDGPNGDSVNETIDIAFDWSAMKGV